MSRILTLYLCEATVPKSRSKVHSTFLDTLAPPPFFFFLLPFPSRNLFAQLSPTHRGNLSLSTEYKSVETSSTCSRRKRKEKRRNTYFLLSNDLDRTRFSKDEKIIEGISILFYSDRGEKRYGRSVTWVSTRAPRLGHAQSEEACSDRVTRYCESKGTRGRRA